MHESQHYTCVAIDLTVGVVAVLVLGVGDVAATLFGKKWGKHYKLYRQKSLAGVHGP